MAPPTNPETFLFARDMFGTVKVAEPARHAAFAAGETKDRAGELAGEAADRRLVAAVAKLPSYHS